MQLSKERKEGKKNSVKCEFSGQGRIDVIQKNQCCPEISASLTSSSPPSTWIKPLVQDISQFRVVQVDIAVIHSYVPVHGVSIFGAILIKI